MDWVAEGMMVLVPWKQRGHAPRKVLCLVVTSMGNTARCCNELHGIDTWFNVEQLEIPEAQPREDT